MDQQAVSEEKKDCIPGVAVEIDGKSRRIRKGPYQVPELKLALGVPPDYELEQVIDCEFKALPDSGHIVIHGGEIFVSHVPRGANS